MNTSTYEVSETTLRPSGRRHQNVSSVHDINWAIGWNRKILKFLGLWTYSKKSRWRNIVANFQTGLFAICLFLFITFPQTLALIKIWGDLTLIVDNLIVNLPITTAEFKLIILWSKKKALAIIFEAIERDWQEQKTPHERNVMLKYAKISRIMTIFGFLGAGFSILTYHGPLAFGVVLRTLTNLTDVPGSLFTLQSTYFFDTTPMSHHRLTVLSQVMGCILSAFAYTGTDVLFGMIVLHVCAQLENLAYKIQKTVGDTSENFQKVLKLNVMRHERLIRFAGEIENVFSMMLLALVASFGIVFCIQGFQLISVFTDSVDLPVIQIAFCVIYTNYFLFLMFVYSWVGEILVTQSQAVNTAVCNCNWTSLTPKESTQLTLLIIRSQQPLQITAGKFVPVTLPTFAKLIKTSAGYISVLLAVKD